MQTDKVIALDAEGVYRAVQRLPVQGGKREYWLQLFHKDGQWRDVRGPYWQRPAVLRRLADPVVF